MSSARIGRPGDVERPAGTSGEPAAGQANTRDGRLSDHPPGESPQYADGGGILSATSRCAGDHEADPLMALVALVEGCRPDAAAFRHAGFLEWLAREGSRQDGAGREEWSDAQVDRLVAELMARLDVAALAVPRIVGAPEVRRAPVAGIVGRVLTRASAQGCAPWLDLAIAAGSGRALWDEACESWVALPPGVKRGGGGGQFVALTVAGDSMTPLLHSGDVILVRLGPEATRGSVVVARRPDEGFVVKHVGAVDGASMELRSLNAAFPPITVPRTAGTVVGTVVLSWCTHGGVDRAGA